MARVAIGTGRIPRADSHGLGKADEGPEWTVVLPRPRQATHIRDEES